MVVAAYAPDQRRMHMTWRRPHAPRTTATHCNRPAHTTTTDEDDGASAGLLHILLVCAGPYGREGNVEEEDSLLACRVLSQAPTTIHRQPLPA